MSRVIRELVPALLIGCLVSLSPTMQPASAHSQATASEQVSGPADLEGFPVEAVRVAHRTMQAATGSAPEQAALHALPAIKAVEALDPSLDPGDEPEQASPLPLGTLAPNGASRTGQASARSTGATLRLFPTGPPGAAIRQHA